MKYFSLIFTLLLSGFSIASGQEDQKKSSPYKIITQLKNNTWEVKTYSADSLLFSKGSLAGRDPDIRQGKCYFYRKNGTVAAMGQYNQDIPAGNWLYFNDSMKVVNSVNYTAVWNYLQNDASEYGIDSATLARLSTDALSKIDTDGAFRTADRMPTFTYGEPEILFNDYLYENLVYPVAQSGSPAPVGIRISFIVDSKGEIRNPVILNPQSPDLNIEIMRLLSESPKWQPGLVENIPVCVKYDWIIFFPDSLKRDDLPLYSESLLAPPDDTYTIVDEMPSFPGGPDSERELLKFVSKNLHYPEQAEEAGISGTVIVSFVINTNGEVTNVRPLNSVHPLLDREAVRVIYKMPPWIPGKQDGKPVKVYFVVPIRFVLE